MYPGLVSCPFYAIPIYPFKFMKFFIYLYIYIYIYIFMHNNKTYLDVHVFGEHDVLALEISVNDSLAVAVCDAG